MKILIPVAGAVLLSACSAHSDTPPAIGMANPASVYCEKVGGKLDIVNENAGQVGYCTLPGGERIEEWALYRRDHK